MSDVLKIASFLDETKKLLGRLSVPSISAAKKIFLDAYRTQGRIYLMGNGGSAATAQHFACALAKDVLPPGKRPFDACCLTDNVPLYTAWANDASRENVFVNLMLGLLRPGDVVIAISVHGGSEFSPELVNGIRYAKKAGARTIALVGFDGGLLRHECECPILVPVNSTLQTEAIHAVIQHLLVQLIKDELAGT